MNYLVRYLPSTISVATVFTISIVRTRWVDYKDKEFDPSHIEPGWHAWISYMVDKPPTEDPILRTGVRPWELPDHRPNMTASRSAFKTYST
ncbi:hypothetical protein ACMFMG_004951 [Clarireedia jacksonii]